MMNMKEDNVDTVHDHGCKDCDCCDCGKDCDCCGVDSVMTIEKKPSHHSVCVLGFLSIGLIVGAVLGVKYHKELMKYNKDVNKAFVKGAKQVRSYDYSHLNNDTVQKLNKNVKKLISRLSK